MRFCDGKEVLIPGIMEHIERSGVHSGDSMAIYPALNLTSEEVDAIVDYTTRIGLEMKIQGLMNVQFVIVGDKKYRGGNVTKGNSDATKVYVLEVNPRASRTIPFISKVTGVPMVSLATRIMLGKSLKELGYSGGLRPSKNLVAVKVPVFSMSKLSGLDSYLGPEMKSTGEVMAVDFELQSALVKALAATNLNLVPNGGVLLSIADKDKLESMALIKDVFRTGWQLYATEGTGELVKSMGGEVTMITKKLKEGHPNVVDVINDGKISDGYKHSF